MRLRPSVGKAKSGTPLVLTFAMSEGSQNLSTRRRERFYEWGNIPLCVCLALEELAVKTVKQ